MWVMPETRLDRYDIAVLRWVRGQEEQDSKTPAIVDIFKGLQDQSTKCYPTLRFRLKSLAETGYLVLDKQRDRVFVELTDKGRAILQTDNVGHESPHCQEA